MSDLSILCVSKLGAHAEPFLRDMANLADGLEAEFVLALDGHHTAPASISPAYFVQAAVQSGGYIESVLDEAIAACTRPYILRLDDDERVSVGMAWWLQERAYRAADHWTFPRMHLWPDAAHYITNAPLWPDFQTRLSVKAKAGGRPMIHQGSPYGAGKIVADERVTIEHHKFLARGLAEREALLKHYDALQPGAGGDRFAPFSVLERWADFWDVRPVPC